MYVAKKSSKGSPQEYTNSSNSSSNALWLYEKGKPVHKIVLGCSLNSGDESKQGSAGVGIPVVGSTKGYIDALRVNPADDGLVTFVMAAFLQQLSHVNCQPAVGGTPGRDAGWDWKIYSSTDPGSLDAQLSCGLPLATGSQVGETSCWRTKSTSIPVTEGWFHTWITCVIVETVIPEQSL